MIRVAVDAMGGDSAPQAEIAGVVEALTTLPDDFTVQLVGRPDVDRGGALPPPRRRSHPPRHPRGSRRHRHGREATGGGSPQAELERRGGPHPPEERLSDAFVSAGNTGAMLAASTLLLGLHEGVERATVATLFPTGGEPVLVIDGGANLDASAQGTRRLRPSRYRLPPRPLRPPQARRRPSQRRRGRGKGHGRRSGGPPAAQAGSRESTTPATSRAATSCRARSSGCRSMSWCATAS